MVDLLRTKLFIPRRRPNLVSRPRLVDAMNVGLDRKLTLIAAPAGFGKTTLLSEWIPNCPRCVTWLSLDEGDNDLTLFWAYFITSLQQLHAGLGQNALALLQSPQAPPIQAILTALINDLSAFPDPFCAVLDDYHAIDSQPVHSALVFLLAHLPANMHLVISTRSDPPLGLARLRASDQLDEFRANALRFTPGEAAAFLQAMGLSLSLEEVAALDERLEGWISGLQIAALSMQGYDDLPAFIRVFSGSHRHILGFLAEEVLNQRPKGTLSFLLQTSILDQMCGPLCDAVTGEPGGQAILESLERANLFIAPLDEEGRWYRYHPLFSEVLRARLHQASPGLAPELHRRAGRWFAGQGMTEEAVRYLLAGEDFDEAARLIERAAADMLRRGTAALLGRWLDAMPGEMVGARPRLCLARGWTHLWGPEFSLEDAYDWAQRALQRASQDGQPQADLEGEIYALEALISADQVELGRSRELAHRALECLPAGSPWLGVTTFCLGSSLFASGELAAAVPILAEALRLSQVDGNLYIRFLAASFLADIQAFQGRLDHAMEAYRQVLSWGDPRIPQKGALVAHAGLANVLCEQGQLDEALAHVQAGIDQLDQVGGPGATLWLYRTLARIHQAKGNWPEALEAADRVLQSGQKAGMPFVIGQALALRADLLLAQGEFAGAARWAAGSGLDPLDEQAGHAGVRAVEYITLARVLSAQGQHAEALALLDRLLEGSLDEDQRTNAIRILAVQGLILQAQGSPARALERLERALGLAEPGGFLRTFVDEGEPMRQLLREYQARLEQQTGNGAGGERLRLLAYAGTLLAAFSAPAHAKAPGQALVEPLSERELEILQLIAAGRSNLEIAGLLFIAVSTVKSHINSLYGKLGAQRRTQAIAIARGLGLLSE